MTNQPHILALVNTHPRPLPNVGQFTWSHEEGRLVWKGMVFGSMEELAPEFGKAIEHLKELDNPFISMALVASKATPSGNDETRMANDDPEAPAPAQVAQKEAHGCGIPGCFVETGLGEPTGHVVVPWNPAPAAPEPIPQSSKSKRKVIPVPSLHHSTTPATP